MRAMLLLLILGFAACATLAPPSGPPSFADARSVCSAIAEGRAEFIDVASGYDGHEHRASTPIDIDNDGDLDHIAIIASGTSQTPVIELRSVEPAEPAYVESSYLDGDQVAFGPWGGQLKLIRDGDRVYEVFYSDATTLDYPVYAAIHLPNGEGRWVCAFQSNAPLTRLEALDSRATTSRICTTLEAQRGETEVMPFEPITQSSVGWAVTQTGRGELDFMNNGQLHLVRQLDFSSEAGAACHTLFYDLAESQNSVAAVALASLQGRDMSDHYAVVRSSNGGGVCTETSRASITSTAASSSSSAFPVTDRSGATRNSGGFPGSRTAKRSACVRRVSSSTCRARSVTIPRSTPRPPEIAALA